MTLDRWLILIVALFGVVQTVLLRMVIFGRWSQRVEHPAALIELKFEVAKLTTEIVGLRDLFHGRYTTLEARQNSDHVLIRELLTWRAGLLIDLEKHFYSRAIQDRMEAECQTDRQELRTDLNALMKRRATD